MSVLQHFFNSFHHLPPPMQRNLPFIVDSSNNALSIVLCVNANNIELFMQCPSFVNLLPDSRQIPSNLALGYTSNPLDYILAMQTSIITQNPHIFEELMPYFANLNLAGVIDDEQLRLFSLLKHTTPSHISISTNKSSKTKYLKTFHTQFHALFELLTPLLSKDSLLQAMDKNLTKLEEQRFCIGITGVLSAGKSTFLNALLGQEVLGTSSVPETANLSVLRYGETPRARVHFWSKEQWEDLESQSAYDSNLKAFVKESKEHFKDTLQDFITSPKYSKDIELNDLSAYTSANHTSKFCNLVEKVELFMPLAFLENGVEIVDTPGLDDPITKREDITREYIEHCDMLIHIMNVSCAATQKDIDFILEALLEQNISRLLVVLTRIDLLTQKELESSLEYTKSSLISQLKNAKYKGDIQSLIQRIDFIPLAGYAALLHRIQKADSKDKPTMSLEESGILEIESYLQTMLLGQDSLKAKDKLYLAFKAMLKIAQDEKELIEIESALLCASGEELDSLISKYTAQNQALLDTLQNFESHLSVLNTDLADFLNSLGILSHNTLSKSATLIKDKVLNDILYDFERGAKPQAQAFCVMIEQGLKDCFADILREYKYKLSRKITQLKSDIAPQDSINAMESSQSDTLPSVHFQLKSSEITHILQILESLPQALSPKPERLKANLDSLFKDIFESFDGLIKEKNTAIKTLFMTHFEQIAQHKKQEIEEEIKNKQESLESALATKNNGNAEVQKDRIQSKQSQIQDIAKQITHTLEELS
ncbi:putative ATP/GTP binding protein [Helicobacter cinaedi PAGU611]|uniref:Dynamin family n=1 Tax=Helicobacter cinaedi CCUG 18818 = ATCC BAA-847 TaxID=537971 RepID=A0ABN0B9J5_9HELI|nr:dynamin family protein [Helicobacter cinaedi]EFR46269.1 dynamin family [Helicobacter cinaedi CCUG 18818 = ATCC BAA-847]QOQ90498.1 dynamin family protein [Helicobacter cinaedi]BAM11398.1 putative ATP/GTP binding protein [Helicobacter cinaedi PAGU611]